MIAEARRRGASHIAVAMSGAAVQRGETAICSKHERAAAAVANGADLVIELPAPFSCSAAPWFADSAVQILGQLNINALAFGSEFESAELLKNAANAMQNLSDSEAVKRALAGGLSYPAALKAAALKIYGEEIAAAVSSPNSTLACEYITALSKYAPNAEIIPVKRVGAGHDLPPQDGFASGSYLRGAIQNGGNALEYLPNGVNITPPKQPQAAENAIYYHLLTATREQFLRLPEVNENLADRILRAAEQPAEDLQTFLAQVKPRNFTLARIRRSALHLAIGAEKSRLYGRRAVPADTGVQQARSGDNRSGERRSADLDIAAKAGKKLDAGGAHRGNREPRGTADADEHGHFRERVHAENRARRLTNSAICDIIKAKII